MKFLFYNKIKILRIGAIAYLLCVVPLFMAGWSSLVGFTLVLSLPFLPACIAMGVFTIKGTFYFRSVETLIDEHTEKSIMPLLDNHMYSIVLKNEESNFFFTKERLRATIAGLPVSIDLSNESGTKRWIMIFSFYPLSQPNTTDKAMLNISFYTGFRHRLNKDVKPEVLQFVEDLKAKGYTAASTTPSHTTL